MSGAEGTRGGSEKRPGSGPAEIEKLPRVVCRVCRMGGVRSLFVDSPGLFGYQCANAVACRKRAAKLPKPPAPPPPSPPPPSKDKRPKVPAPK